MRLLPLLASLALVLAGTAAALAQDAALTDDERAAIESRLAALEEERAELRRRLAEDEAPGDADREIGEVLTTRVSGEELEEVEERRELERQSARNPFSITTHRRNYLLPLSYNRHTNDGVYGNISENGEPDRGEVKFQFSAKFQLIDDLFGSNGDLYFAYTQRSWWQAYNTDDSSPFRETNYEPEIFLDFDSRWSLLGWTNINNRIGFNHQSNGRSDPLSRSWNRVIAESTFLNDDWAVTLAPHWRVPESASEDDNPDIDRYMGYGDVTVAHRFNDDHEASLLVRGNPSAGNMGARLDYSWPLFGNVRGHVQYYQGYGDSMIDYDHRTQRLGVGFSLNPLFSGGDLNR